MMNLAERLSENELVRYHVEQLERTISLFMPYEQAEMMTKKIKEIIDGRAEEKLA